MSQRLLKWIRNYFGFNKTETYGVIVIHLAILVMILTPMLFEQFLISNLNLSELQLAPESVEKEAEVIKNPKKDSLFEFDPNQVSSKDLVLLGLPDFMANRIINFRAKGGSFKTSDDLYIIYGIDSAWVRHVSSFAKITETDKHVPEKRKIIKRGISKEEPVKKDSPELIKSDINLADTALLQQVKGIGKILSARIIKFRDKLGGFYTMNQLGEVYGVPPEVIDLLTSQYFVDAGFEPNTINVNTCTREELEAHPYIRRKLAELIINYRENHFPIELEDLANIPILTPEIQVKIIPYLSFE